MMNVSTALDGSVIHAMRMYPTWEVRQKSGAMSKPITTHVVCLLFIVTFIQVHRQELLQVHLGTHGILSPNMIEKFIKNRKIFRQQPDTH